MSIEKALADLTEALNANTAALLKAAGTTPAAAAVAEPATEKKGPGRPKKEEAAAPAPAKTAPAKAKARTQEEMVAALEEVKDKISLDAAKKIISEVGGVDKRKDIPADKYTAVYDAAKAALEPAAGEDDAAEEDEGM